MPFRLNVLGPPEVLGPGGDAISVPLGKPFGLLVILACQEKPQSREALAAMLWPNLERGGARHSLRQAVWVLKNLVGENLIDGDGSLTIREGALSTDLSELRQVLAEGRIREARTLWRGPFLDGFALPGLRLWDRWVEDTRTDLDRRFQEALLHQAQISAEEADPEAALRELEAAVGVNPGNQRAHELRIALLIDLRRFDAAREALSDAYRFMGDEPETRIELKALDDRLTEALRRGHSVADMESGFALEFVGRSSELVALGKVWERTCAGVSHVVVVTGASGIGKTRLGQEFCNGTLGDDAQTVQIKGTRAGMKLRWGGAADLARQLLLLPGSAGISLSSDSLLKTMVPSLGREGVTLQTVNGVSPAALLDATVDLLDSVSFEAPLLILIDDFQWLDPESRTLLLSLMSRRSEFRSLILIMGRPDLSSRSWKEVEETLVREHGAPVLSLRPLQLEEVRELLGLLATFPDEEDANRVASRIHDVSGGNPLFIKGLVQELHDQGIFQKGEEGWEAHTQELPLHFTFPETIKALMAERLNRLSREGAKVASALAAMGGSGVSSHLQQVSLMEETALTTGITELLEREVVQWGEEDRLEFSHSLLGEAAAEHLPPLPSAPHPLLWGMSRKVLIGVAVGVALSLSLGILRGSGFLAEGAPAEPPLFGGGTIAIIRQQTLVGAIRVTDAPPSNWETTDALGSTPERIQTISRVPGDSLVFLGFNPEDSGPDAVQILPDGTRRTILGGPGDQVIFDLSPDGKHVLVGVEDLEAPEFSRDLFDVELGGDNPRLLYKAWGPTGPALWSRDGDIIALSVEAAEDTLVLLSREGRRLASRTFREVGDMEWCGSSLLIVARTDGPLQLLKLDVPDLAVTTLDTISVATPLTCSPDGSAAAYQGIREGKVVAMARDMESGETFPLQATEMAGVNLSWVPDHAAPVPVLLDIQEDSLSLDWGARVPLHPSLLYSDGSRSTDRIRWESLDPSIATVDGQHTLTGNGAGATRVVASWGHSLSDTLSVTVLDSGEGGAFLRDQFSELDTMRWIPVGEEPFVATRGGESVLILPGDEKYMDGLISRRPIPSEHGVTAELEFRIELTHQLHQSLSLCLRDLDIPGPEVQVRELLSVGEQICFQYPARESAKLDPREISLRTESLVESIYSMESPPNGEEWTHAGIQLRADGEVSLIVNRKKVAISPVRVSVIPQGGWHLTLDGRAMGTELQVRDVVVWREPRY